MVTTVLMDLSKAYDCIQHDFLIAKLSGYDIDSVELLLISDYLSHRKQRTKIGSPYNFWHGIIRRFPQGSLLGPLLFNTFIMICFYLSESLEFVTSQRIIHYIVLEKTLKMLFQTCKLILLG